MPPIFAEHIQRKLFLKKNKTRRKSSLHLQNRRTWRKSDFCNQRRAKETHYIVMWQTYSTISFIRNWPNQWHPTFWKKVVFGVVADNRGGWSLIFLTLRYMGVAIGGEEGHAPPRFLAYIDILCSENRRTKQNIVVRLKSNILPQKKFLDPKNFGFRHFRKYRSRLPTPPPIVPPPTYPATPCLLSSIQTPANINCFPATIRSWYPWDSLNRLGLNASWFVPEHLGCDTTIVPSLSKSDVNKRVNDATNLSCPLRIGRRRRRERFPSCRINLFASLVVSFFCWNAENVINS